MMIIKDGDLLRATEVVICHQVNPDGIMGGGVALAIATNYPKCEEEYRTFCMENECDYQRMKGGVFISKIDETRIIANCFTQNPNFITDYKALEEAFEAIFKYCKKNNLTIAIPYKYGCGIASGNWDTVSSIINKISNQYGIDITAYRKEV